VACLEGVTHGLYLLWWVQEKELSPAVVAAILAAGDVALMALEVPTGWFADRFGHRASLILGSVIQVVAMLLCWLGVGIPALAVASVLVALGDGFRSGADQALLYRTCVALGREDRFLAIESRTHTLEVCALVALVALGGALASIWALHAAWAAEVFLCAVGTLIAWTMREPPACSAAAHDEGGAAEPMFVSKELLLLIAPAALIGGAASATSFLAQTSGGGGAVELTALVAMITVAEAAGAAAAPWITAANLRGQMLLVLSGAGVVAAGFWWPAAFSAVVVALSFLTGLAEPLRAAAIQRVAADGVRARAASVARACDMAVSTLALPLAGFWRT
jgi:MFS family permease